MPEPDKEAVLQAMRSDLGVGRVDDLELENGRQGRTARPGHTNQAVPYKVSPAPPKNPLPLANRWQDAIEKGEFDDDDAEAVKGLDRIGGGRLHAQKPTVSFPAHHPHPFNAPRLPGLPHDRMRVSFRLPPPKALQDTRGLGIFANSPMRRFEATPVRQSVLRVGQRPNIAGSSRPITAFQKSSPMRPTPHHDIKSLAKGDDTNLTPRQPGLSVDVPYPQEAEPSEYFYKAVIRVADRHAKGKGAVYLLTSSPTDSGTLSVYLEGLKYLEYPVLSMYNYITSSTELCPQFKEADGLSITTTSLVFGSQDKIAHFMQAVKSLKGRDPSACLVGSQTSTPMKLSLEQSSGMNETDSGQLESQGASNGHSSEGTKNLATIPTRGGNTRPLSGSTLLVSNINGTHKTHKQNAAEMACDLVDLSQPTETNASKPIVRAGQMSTYAMDLESLCSPDVTPAVPFSSESGPSTATQANNSQENSPKTRKGEQSGTSALASPSQSYRSLPPSLTGPTEILTSSLLHILPTFEAMSQMLSTITEKNREETAKAIFANIRVGGSDEDEEWFASAKQLMLALLARSGKSKVASATEAPSPFRGPKYTREDLTRLRGCGMPPPQPLLQLEFLPRTAKTSTSPSQSTAKGSNQSIVLHHTDKQNRSFLQPSANVFQPKHAGDKTKFLETKNAKHDTSSVSMATASENLPSIPSPSTLACLSNTTNSANTAASTATVQSPPAPEVKGNGFVKKGLRGSRWATDSDGVRPENANHFTGIDIPR